MLVFIKLNIGGSAGSFTGFSNRVHQIEAGFIFTVPQHEFLIEVPEILDAGNDWIGRRMSKTTPAEFEGLAPLKQVIYVLNHTMAVQDLL
jgi:hypothetical protein